MAAERKRTRRPRFARRAPQTALGWRLAMVGGVFTASLAIAVVATIHPSRSAAGLVPVEAIRHE